MWSEPGLDGREDLAEPGKNGRERAQHEQNYELWEYEAVAGASNELGQMLRPDCGLMGDEFRKQDGTSIDMGLECRQSITNQTEYHHHSYLIVRF